MRNDNGRYETRLRGEERAAQAEHTRLRKEKRATELDKEFANSVHEIRPRLNDRGWRCVACYTKRPRAKIIQHEVMKQSEVK